ncbi:uncharacterized protein [Epargyreus clarus]|uniref:uncharacterized protein n=1 Tax=Epargyreus clarus TaxID=520877 RepID=UPI003C2B892F
MPQRFMSFCLTHDKIVIAAGLMVSVGMFHDVYHATKNTGRALWAHTRPTFLMFVPNYILICAVFVMSAGDGPGRMERIMYYYKRVEKIHENIENKFKPKGLNKMLTCKLVVGVMTGLTASIMKTVYCNYEIIQLGKSVIVELLYFFVYIESTISCALTLQIVFVLTSILWSFKSLNKCVRRLHDGFLNTGKKTGHNAAIINNIHRFSKIYASLIELSRLVNRSEGGTISILFCNFFFRIILCVYYSISSFYSKDS